ncbi:MAG: hypothetical protein KF869_06930 [Phycisphaeraceae bacterium]|nr:hypothetical protein [Phycisphaeraceae bacterium]
MIGRKLTSTLVLAASIGACAFAASPALAQRGVTVGTRMGPGGMDFAAPVNKADLKRYVALLALDEDQTMVAEELLAAMQTEHDVLAKQARKDSERIINEFRDSQDPSVFGEEMPKVMETYQAGSASLQARYFDDLKALLTPQQTERWPKVERMHRRTRSLPAGMLSGESVDLVSIVSELEIGTAPDDLAAVLDRYEAELDRELVERDRVRTERMQGMQGMRGGRMNFDLERMRTDLAEMRKAGLKVCEVNKRYARLIEGTLPSDKQRAFADRVKKDSFPRIYRDTHTAKCLAAAAAYKDLSAEQASAIAELRERYQREAASINDRWAQAQEATEADGGGDPFAMFMGGGEDGPVADARKAKRDLDRTTRDKLLALLSEEQKERLPEREDDGPGMMFRMGG